VDGGIADLILPVCDLPPRSLIPFELGNRRLHSPAFIDAQVEMTLSPCFRFYLAYDPRLALRKIKGLVLAINGVPDLQVPGRRQPAGDSRGVAGGREHQLLDDGSAQSEPPQTAKNRLGCGVRDDRGNDRAIGPRSHRGLDSSADPVSACSTGADPARFPSADGPLESARLALNMTETKRRSTAAASERVAFLPFDSLQGGRPTKWPRTPIRGRRLQ
jgi:hypothetical protein